MNGDVYAPSGVVTFLFTDIEGSARRWEADADGMRAALGEQMSNAARVNYALDQIEQVRAAISER